MCVSYYVKLTRVRTHIYLFPRNEDFQGRNGFAPGPISDDFSAILRPLYFSGDKDYKTLIIFASEKSTLIIFSYGINVLGV